MFVCGSGSVASTLSNCPTTWAFKLYVIASITISRYVQFLHDINDVIWFRTNQGTSWDNWQKISTDIPTFYKNYANLAALQVGLGVPVYKGFDTGVKRLKITISGEGSYAYMTFFSNSVGKTCLMQVVLRNWGNGAQCHGFASGDFKIYYTPTNGVYYLYLDDGGQYGNIMYAVNIGRNVQVEVASEIPSESTEMIID